MLNNVTQFSDWTLNALAPTSAPADIGGRVMKADGSPLAGARMILSGLNAQPVTLTSTSNINGIYIFQNISTGNSYSEAATVRFR